jgi:hypothetical protein
LSPKRYDGGMAITGAGITAIGVGTTGIGVGATGIGVGIIAGTAIIGATGRLAHRHVLVERKCIGKSGHSLHFH